MPEYSWDIQYNYISTLSSDLSWKIQKWLIYVDGFSNITHNIYVFLLTNCIIWSKYIASIENNNWPLCYKILRKTVNRGIL